jgi:hypothetical protein
MTKTVFHIVFSPSGGEDLRDALRNAGRDDRVIGLPDDLRFGPIDGDNPWLRAKWINNELGLTGWGDVGRIRAFRASGQIRRGHAPLRGPVARGTSGLPREPGLRKSDLIPPRARWLIAS